MCIMNDVPCEEKKINNLSYNIVCLKENKKKTNSLFGVVVSVVDQIHS